MVNSLSQAIRTLETMLRSRGLDAARLTITLRSEEEKVALLRGVCAENFVPAPPVGRGPVNLTLGRLDITLEAEEP